MLTAIRGGSNYQDSRGQRLVDKTTTSAPITISRQWSSRDGEQNRDDRGRSGYAANTAPRDHGSRDRNWRRSGAYGGYGANAVESEYNRAKSTSGWKSRSRPRSSRWKSSSSSSSSSDWKQHRSHRSHRSGDQKQWDTGYGGNRGGYSGEGRGWYRGDRARGGYADSSRSGRGVGGYRDYLRDRDDRGRRSSSSSRWSSSISSSDINSDWDRRKRDRWDNDRDVRGYSYRGNRGGYDGNDGTSGERTREDRTYDQWHKGYGSNKADEGERTSGGWNTRGWQ